MNVKTLCLGGLLLGPSSGYDLRKLFEKGPLGMFQEPAIGSIYPALKSLTAEGLIEECEARPDQRPESRVYRITAAGQDRLIGVLMQPPGADRFRSDFLFTLFFSHHLPDGHVVRLIEDRLAEVRASLAHLDGCAAKSNRPGWAVVLDYGRAVHRAEIAYLEHLRFPHAPDAPEADPASASPRAAE